MRYFQKAKDTNLKRKYWICVNSNNFDVKYSDQKIKNKQNSTIISETNYIRLSKVITDKKTMF